MDRHWIDFVAAFGSAFTPVVVVVFTLILTIIGWKYRQSLERSLKLEEQLRADRVEIYKRILDPFIIMFMSDAAWAADPKNKSKDKNASAIALMMSVDYRKTSFHLSLIGSDGVVTAHSNLFQYMYNTSDYDTQKVMSLLGNFLLEIRKSMGNESTSLDNWGMLKWFITDISKFADADRQP